MYLSIQSALMVSLHYILPPPHPHKHTHHTHTSDFYLLYLLFSFTLFDIPYPLGMWQAGRSNHVMSATWEEAVAYLKTG